MSAGTSYRISSHTRKKVSTAFLLVKMTAVKSAKLIFSLRTSLAGTPSTWMNPLKSNFKLYFSANAKYGDLSFSGLGKVTKILFTFLALASSTCIFNFLVAQCSNQYQNRRYFKCAKIQN